MLSFLSCVFISEVKWLFKCLLAMCELLLLNFWLLFHIFKSSLYLAGRSTESWLRYQTTYRFWKKKTCNQEKKSMRIKRKEWVRKDNQNRTCTSQGTPITCAGPVLCACYFSNSHLQLPTGQMNVSLEKRSRIIKIWALAHLPLLTPTRCSNLTYHAVPFFLLPATLHFAKVCALDYRIQIFR